MSAIHLQVAPATAHLQIEDRIRAGRAILEIGGPTEEALKEARRRFSRWDDFNEQLLGNMFSEPDEAERYAYVGARAYSMAPTLWDLSRELEFDVEDKIDRLESLLGRLSLFEVAETEAAGSVATSAQAVRSAPLTDGRNRVFVVHGHGERKHEVARVIERFESLEAVILDEAPFLGSPTIIEKLERETADCGYAVVIYTGDDEGRNVGSDDPPQRRARENVVLELGYFLGQLDRGRVTVLLEPGVAFPSDFRGVGYYELDPAGAWKARLVQELGIVFEA